MAQLIDLANSIQHKLNPLHIFVRLIKKGLSCEEALTIASIYEILIYNEVLEEVLYELHDEAHKEFLKLIDSQ